MKQLDLFSYKYDNKLAYFLSKRAYLSSSIMLPSAHKFNHILSELLYSDSRFLLGRIGDLESRLLYRYLTKKSLYNQFLSIDLRNGAGIYPPSEHTFISDSYLNALRDFTFLGDWPTVGQAEIKKYLNSQEISPIYFELECLNPLHMALKYKIQPRHLWLRAIKSLNILVISPFEQSFRSSTTRDISSFENELLPSLNYTCIKPPVTFGSFRGTFSFVDNLARCCEEINVECSKKKYDLALVSAGGYGFLIAHHIYKNTNISKVLHLGGVLQLYFGLIGKRWLSAPYSEVYRDYPSLKDWSRPLSDESSLGLNVEGGCYS